LNPDFEGVAMRTFALMLIVCSLIVVGCTTTPTQEKPKVHCPACGSEIDVIFQKRF
jgi:DNA-directed RNA polymerase subunit RPC12/RpoP